MNDYTKRIQALTTQVSTTLVDFSAPRTEGRMPTQASSNFITNKEQGDWAEDVLFRAVNDYSDELVAVRYGKSDDIVAGDEGFADFYQSYQRELDEIGKRPDLILFKKADYREDWGKDISHRSHDEILEYVKKAVAGIEVRSSAFLIDSYDEAMRQHTAMHTQRAMEMRDRIIAEFSDLLTKERKPYFDLVSALTEKNLAVQSFKLPSWRSSERLAELSACFKRMKESIKEIQKRDYLSITPKVEDLKVVNKWIETTGVPHYYVQVFFDKIYGISFESILRMISNTENESKAFSVEEDTKNQNKTTIKIDTKQGICIAACVDEPAHCSVRKEMGRGRLLFYVHFDGGKAWLDADKFHALFGHTL